jgi:hypothetical protein
MKQVAVITTLAIKAYSDQNMHDKQRKQQEQTSDNNKHSIIVSLLLHLIN